MRESEPNGRAPSFPTAGKTFVLSFTLSSQVRRRSCRHSPSVVLQYFAPHKAHQRVLGVLAPGPQKSRRGIIARRLQSGQRRGLISVMKKVNVPSNRTLKASVTRKLGIV